MRAALFILMIAAAASAGAAPVGTAVDNLRFKDIRYLPRTLDDFDKPAKPKGYVLFFQTIECPLAQRYLGKLVELDKEFGPKGIQFVGVNAGPDDTIMEMAGHALDYGAHFPQVKDTTGETVKKLGITRTPEVVLLDAARTVRYRGRVDDQFRLGGARPEAGRLDLRIALEEFLAGTPIAVASTEPEGCSITAAKTPAPETPITYAEHVAPILDRHCVTCHRPDGGAPMPFLGFKKASAYADMIAEVVGEGRMPPWYAEPGIGEFVNAHTMTDAERTTIAQWFAGGAAEGDPAKAPPPRVFPETEWHIQPDAIVHASQQIVLPPSGIVDYKYIFMPYEFQQDTWVQGIEIRATNPRVLHHANLFYSPTGLDFKRAENFLTGTVPGGVPADLKDGQAFFIPKGARIGLQLHYVTTGKMEADKPMVALRFAKEPVRKRLYYKIIDDSRFAIPPYDRAHPVKAVRTLEDNATVTGLFGHLHVRGRDMTLTAHLPDGTRRPLLRLPNYNFDWQLAYYTPPGSLKLPAGTKVECLTHFDNSAFNPYNPDPTVTVEEGPQTTDEMMQGFMFYTKDDETLNIQVDPATGWAIEQVAQALP